MLPLPRSDLVEPGLSVSNTHSRDKSTTHFGEDLLEHHARIADNRDVGLDVLADTRGIDIDMYDLCPTSELIQLAGHSIIESRTDRDDQVAVVDGHIGPVATVHAQHSEAERMTCRKGPKPHQGARCRQLKLLGKLPHLIVRPGRHCASANIEHRPLGLYHCIESALDLAGMALQRWLVAAHCDRFGILELCLLRRHVLWHINQDGS